MIMRMFMLLLLLILFQYSVQDSMCYESRLPDDGHAILYSDLIIEAVVKNISQEKIPYSEWYPEQPQLQSIYTSIKNIELKIFKVLKGVYSEDLISIVVHAGTDLYGEFAVGDTLILCLNYHQPLKGGSYYLKESSGKFIRREGRWQHYGKHGWDQITVNYNDILAKIEETALENIIRQADLIIIGTVRNYRTAQSEGVGDTLKNRVRIIEMEIASLLKGNTADKTISIRTKGFGESRPKWWKKVPRGINIGEQWLVFLKKDDKGFFPFAEKNSFLKVDNGRLIYDNRVEYRYDVNAIEATIEETK